MSYFNNSVLNKLLIFEYPFIQGKSAFSLDITDSFIKKYIYRYIFVNINNSGYYCITCNNIHDQTITYIRNIDISQMNCYLEPCKYCCDKIFYTPNISPPHIIISKRVLIQNIAFREC